MPKKIVVCCDGTWDTSDQRQSGVLTPSNVARIHNAIADEAADGTDQKKYYHSGVGTEEHWWQRVAGAAMGIGLDKHIQAAYQWLGENYEQGDQIYVFGFSRGAYTARTLVGMIHTVGLLKLDGMKGDEARKGVKRAYSSYRQDPDAIIKPDEIFPDSKHLPIRFLGVWDTVGALGIPDHMHLLGVLDNPKRYQFFNTKLTSDVETARHAVALDERRASFMPTLWDESAVEQHQDARQIWFPGVHCDVGGGYRETGLSDGALEWMIHEAQGAGLQFRPGIVDDEDGRKEVVPNAWDARHDSLTGIFAHLRNQPRNVPHFRSENAEHIFHKSVLHRHNYPPITEPDYWPTFILQPGYSKTILIDAQVRWNSTGIYMEPGVQYKLTASGQWANGDDETSPDGVSGMRSFSTSLMVQVKHGIEKLTGAMGNWYRQLTDDEHAELVGTRRDGSSPWGALIGAISNGGNPERDGTPADHTTFLIGSSANWPTDDEGDFQAGYLYCYMNDAWLLYGNNQGSIQLTVKRLDGE